MISPLIFNIDKHNDGSFGIDDPFFFGTCIFWWVQKVIVKFQKVYSLTLILEEG